MLAKNWLQIAILLDYYLKNGSHSEVESESIKKQIIEHAVKSADYRFVYNLLNSYTGRTTTISCPLQSNAGLVDLLFVLAKEGNDAVEKLAKNNAENSTSSGLKFFKLFSFAGLSKLAQ